MGSSSRVFLAGLAVVLVSAATAVVTTIGLRPGSWRSTAAQDDPAKLIFPPGPAETLLWPTDRAWVYSVRLDGAGPKSGIRAEIRTEELGANEGYAFEPVARGAQKQLDIPVQWQTAPDTAMVSIQLVGAGDGPANGSRERERLIVRLKVDGMGVSKEIVIEGTYSGHGDNGYGKWVDGELHLMNVFARSENVVTRYDVVLSE